MKLSVNVRVRFPNARKEKYTPHNFVLDAHLESSASPMVVFGRSGSGKSSLANTISGLVTPERGHICINGVTLFDSEKRINLPTHTRGIGYVFQDARLFPHLTVKKNLLFAQKFFDQQRKIHASNLNPVEMNFNDAIDLLDLGDLLDRMPEHLSGGEKQRVAIGRAMLSRPKILIMDEPLSSLDGKRRNEVLTYIERLVRTVELPLLYISHSMEEVSRLGCELAVMDNGKIIASGEPEKILTRLDLRPMTGRFQAGALLSGEVVSHDSEFSVSTIKFGSSYILAPGMQNFIGQKVRFHIRAQDVSISKTLPSQISIRNILVARIVDIQEENGPFAELALILPDGQQLLARITRHAVHDLSLKVGLDVFALVKSIVLSGHSHLNAPPNSSLES